MNYSVAATARQTELLDAFADDELRFAVVHAFYTKRILQPGTGTLCLSIQQRLCQSSLISDYYRLRSRVAAKLVTMLPVIYFLAVMLSASCAVVRRHSRQATFPILLIGQLNNLIRLSYMDNYSRVH